MKNWPFSLLLALRRYERALCDLPCPGCGGRSRSPIWRTDRYFFTVDLSICHDCGLAHLARGLGGEEAARFYREVYPRLMRQPPQPADLGQAQLIAGYRRATIGNAIGPIDDVIDIGAGLGFFLDACRRAHCQRFHGIEPGDPQRRFALETLGLDGHLEGRPITLLEDPPFPPRLITLFHVLEHLEDPGGVLDILARWLPVDGWLVIEVPDLAADWSALGVMQVHVSHRSYFTGETLVALLAHHGFAVRLIEREAQGIFPGNLRVFAHPGPRATLPAQGGAAQALTAHIQATIKPWSLTNGYPRAALRLLKIAALGG